MLFLFCCPEKIHQADAALPPPTKERTKKANNIIYVIAARRWRSDIPGRKHRAKAKAPPASENAEGCGYLFICLRHG